MQDNSVINRDPHTGAADPPLVLTAMPTNAWQRKIAFRCLLFSLVLVAIAIAPPFATIQLPRLDGFVPAVQTAMCLADLLTATFLFAQYSIQPQGALLVLGSGFLFSGLFAILQTFSFPNAYVPGVLIGDELNSSVWLVVWWQTLFPVAIVVYALTKDLDSARSQFRRSTWNIGIAISSALIATVALTWIANTGLLPSLYQSQTEKTDAALIALFSIVILNATAVALVFVRRKTILDQWLIVTLLAWWPNFAMVAQDAVTRFTVGWYLSRLYALLAGSSLIAVLLIETLHLHTRFANAIVLLRRSEEHQRLLVAELDHRVKNILSQVVGIVDATAQSSGSFDDFVRSFSGRIGSMASAHALLSKSRWRGISLDSLVRTELEPFAAFENIEISGTDVQLSPAQTQALAKALHELATNAVKYGALSVPGGKVLVAWHRELTGPTTSLTLEWRELGGPSVPTMVQSSYGTSMISELIPYELGGSVDLDFASDGVRCKIKFPL